MAIPAQIEDFRLVAATIANGELTRGAVALACAVDLRDARCATPGVRELQGFPVEGPFSIVSLREHLDAAGPAVVTLTPRARMRFYQSDLARHFRFAGDVVVINPRIPPEGTVTYQLVDGERTLVFEFTRRSRTLRKLLIIAAR